MSKEDLKRRVCEAIRARRADIKAVAESVFAEPNWPVVRNRLGHHWCSRPHEGQEEQEDGGASGRT